MFINIPPSLNIKLDIFLMKNTSLIHFVGASLISAKVNYILFLLSTFSLDLRRLKLTLQYIVELKANIDNPAFDCVFNPLFKNLYDKNVLNQLAL